MKMKNGADIAKLELTKIVSNKWNKLPEETRKEFVKYNTSTQLLTLIQLKEMFSDDMSPDLKRKITDWENNIARCLKKDLKEIENENK